MGSRNQELSVDENSFASVAQADAEYRQAAKAAGQPNAEAEARALFALFGDVEACEVCSKKLGANWQDVCLEKWKSWMGISQSTTGKEISRVVQRLDASHLLPSSIHERLTSGNDAACFGLLTLMSNMKESGDQN